MIQVYRAPDPAKVNEALKAIGFDVEKRAEIFSIIIEALVEKEEK